MVRTMVQVSASVLSADLSVLREEVRRVEAAGADMLHIDVMDGIFVPPMTIGDVVVKSLSKSVKCDSAEGKKALTFDSHLMVIEPERVIPFFAQAGSDIISIHVESKCDVKRALAKIRSLGCKAGLAINPPTPVEAAFPYIEDVDMFIVMSVNPGYGGQAFIESSLDKIAALRKEAESRGVDVLIEVDGGINDKTAPDVVKAGADILVAGSYLFNAENMKDAVGTLKLQQ